jgi:hypothetical protein
VVAARIYTEDLAKVTVSHNRLGLSLSKRIKYGLIAKINGKRKSQTYKALDQILTDHSRTHRAPAPITSPRPAGQARIGTINTVLLCLKIGNNLKRIYAYK